MVKHKSRKFYFPLLIKKQIYKTAFIIFVPLDVIKVCRSVVKLTIKKKTIIF